jgi:hypothetical protein
MGLADSKEIIQLLMALPQFNNIRPHLGYSAIGEDFGRSTEQSVDKICKD